MHYFFFFGAIYSVFDFPVSVKRQIICNIIESAWVINSHENGFQNKQLNTPRMSPHAIKKNTV